MLICPQCGSVSSARKRNAKYCSRECAHDATNHRARTTDRASQSIEFIGVDGESRPDGDTNCYHILSVGDLTLYQNGMRLDFVSICEFLYTCFRENRTAAYVGFYLGYDFTYWLKELPAERARMLFHPELRARIASGNNRLPFPVEYKDWEFDLLGMKRFKLRPVGEQSWMYICDVGPFFQTSFLKAIDPSKWPAPICSLEEYQVIVQGKKARGQETQSDKEMIRYNVLENRLLSQLMNRMQDGFKQMGIKIASRNWYGPGSAVNVWLNNIHAPTASKRETHLEDALRASYYGGRFEITAHGPCGTLYEYDINSAYPDAMSQLPMEGGKWISDGSIDDAYCLMHCKLSSGSNYLGPAPHRESSGKSVCYPAMVLGWYWAHELKAATDARLIQDLEVLEVWRYIPGVEFKPFHELRNLYNVRVKVGKDTPQGKAIKLVYNSGYGKLAQSIGQPKYANVMYASLITSYTRTKILASIASHPIGAKDVAMIATDGVYFFSPHVSLNLSETELGAWSHAKRDNMFLIKPGMYFDGEGKVKSRGIGNRDVFKLQDTIRESWTRWDGDCKNWPEFKVYPEFLVISPRAASHRGTWNLCGSISREPFTHSFDPRNKRYYGDGLQIIDDVVRTSIMPRSRTALKRKKDVVESTPYDKMFGVDLDEPGSPAHSGLISESEGEVNIGI